MLAGSDMDDAVAAAPAENFLMDQPVRCSMNRGDGQGGVPVIKVRVTIIYISVVSAILRSHHGREDPREEVPQPT